MYRSLNRLPGCAWPGRIGWAVILGVIAGCGGGGGGGGDNPPPPVAVTVAAPSAQLKVGESQTYVATVTGSSNTAVTWSVTGAGCTAAACGTISSAGVYVAPAIVPQPATVSITATSQADASKSASAGLTIGSDVALAVWPQAARMTVGSSRQFLRTLTGSSNAAVTWSIGGVGCGSGNCGTIGGDGRYVAPAQVPAGVSSVLVTATSVVDPGKSAQATVTLQAQGVQTLNGSYAFIYRGVWGDSESQLAGRFTTLGDGAISAGAIDRTNAVLVNGLPAGNLLNQSYTGSYTVEGDNRGVLTMGFPFGSVVFRTAIPASGERFFMQSFYDTDVRGTALVLKQDDTAFTTSAIKGNYVFQWTGSDVNRVRLAHIGRFSADGAGAISGGTIDSNDGLSGVIDSRTFTGSYSVAGNGRGTMQITIPGLGSYNFAFYVVDAGTLIITSTDELAAGKPMRIGFALRQSGGPFSAASLSGDYVFDMAGRNAATSAIATVGRLTSDGSGKLSGTYDRNDNYVMTPVGGQPVTATYSIDANGRGLLDATSMVRAVFYLASPDKALIMEAPNSRVQTGTLERQVSAPYSTELLVGNFAGVTSAPALLTSLTVTGINSYDGLGNVPSVIDVASPCALAPASPAFANVTTTAQGRIDVRSGGVQHAAGYLITPVRYVMVLQRAGGAPCDEVVHYVTTEQ